MKQSERITFAGKHNLWFDFTHTLAKQHKTVWEVLKPFLQQYIKKHQKE